MARPDLCTECARGIYSPRCLKWGGISCRDRRELYDLGAREALEREAKRVDAALKSQDWSRGDAIAFIKARINSRYDGKCDHVLLEILKPEPKP